MPSQVKAEWAEWEEEDTAMAVRLHLQARLVAVLVHPAAVQAHQAVVLVHPAAVLARLAAVLARLAAEVHQAGWAVSAAWAASATEQTRILRTEREWAT